jgi:hypothetical protein
MTRRICKAAKLHDSGEEYRDDDGWPLYDASIDGAGDIRIVSPFGEPGDRLWIREAFAVARQYNKLAPRELSPRRLTVLYIAGGSSANGSEGWRYEPDFPTVRPDWQGRARPAMFMCRWMTRALLDVVALRVERLQDISEADAQAEGAEPLLVPPDGGCSPYREGFRQLWESINGPGSWARNPWVWVVEFKLSEARP